MLSHLSRIRGPLTTAIAVLSALLISSCAFAQTYPFKVQTVDVTSDTLLRPSVLLMGPSGQLVATDARSEPGHTPAYGYWDGPFTGRILDGTATGWTLHPSSPPFDVSYPNAAVLDQDGYLHVVSWQFPASDESRPLLQDEGATGWTATPLDTTGANGVGVAIDGRGDLWVAFNRVHHGTDYFYYSSPYDLVICHRSPLGWSRDSLVVGGLSFFTPYPLAIDGEGRPHVLFVGVDGYGLYHAVRTASGWQTTVVDTARCAPQPFGQDSSLATPRLALGPDGTPHALYLTGQSLRYARWTGTTWLSDPLPIPQLHFNASYALALDHVGRARITYPAWNDASTEIVLLYASEGSAGWDFATVENNFNLAFWNENLSLVLDASDRPTIYFEGPNQNQISLATIDQTASVSQSRPVPGLTLSLASPNPLGIGQSARWTVNLPVAGNVMLEAFDLAGRRISNSDRVWLAAGVSTMAWTPALSGPSAYFVRARVPGGYSRAVQVCVR